MRKIVSICLISVVTVAAVTTTLLFAQNMIRSIISLDGAEAIIAPVPSAVSGQSVLPDGLNGQSKASIADKKSTSARYIPFDDSGKSVVRSAGQADRTLKGLAETNDVKEDIPQPSSKPLNKQGDAIITTSDADLNKSLDRFNYGSSQIKDSATVQVRDEVTPERAAEDVPMPRLPEFGQNNDSQDEGGGSREVSLPALPGAE